MHPKEPMIVRKVESDEVRHVLRNMRDSDRREIFATRFSEEPDEVADNIMLMCPELAWTVGTVSAGPIAVVCAVPLWPGVWSLGMMATDKLPLIGLSLTKWVKNKMIPALKSGNFQRAECHSIEGHTFAHKWLELLGFTRECSLARYGKNGETFHVYSIVKASP